VKYLITVTMQLEIREELFDNWEHKNHFLSLDSNLKNFSRLMVERKAHYQDYEITWEKSE
tara:strand:+ start:505 stop:684 length:180 start_codon:yes stop_codon:yes gene_type:complete